MAAKEYAGLEAIKAIVDNVKARFSLLGHKHTASDITDLEIPTYELTKDGSTITLVGSNGTSTAVTDDDTKITVDSSLSGSSANPVENKVVHAALEQKVPTTRKINNKALSADITLSASDVGADAFGTATTAVSSHNTNTEAHNDIRLLITGLTNRLNALADSDDTTLDQMSEVVAYIKSNKDLIDSITTSKVNVTDIVNNLTTNVNDRPLSAAQGVAIKSLIDELEVAYKAADTALSNSLTSHTSNTSNPHGVTKEQIGLSNIDNTRDADKPISKSQAAMMRSLELRIYELEKLLNNNNFLTTTPIASPASYFTTDGAGAITGLTDKGKAASEIVIPNEIYGVAITSIGSSAFKSCSSLTSITIPDSVTSINQQVFHNCTNLTSVTIPDSVTSIGRLAFRLCSSLTSITIPDGVTSISDSTFQECSRLASVTIPDGVTSIGSSAFQKCSLTSITIPDGVSSINSYTFYYCTKLTSVTIPDSVTSIGSSAFCNCTSLTSITIPDGVTSIGDSAFQNCTSLTSVTIPDSVTSIGSSAFKSCSSLTTVNYTGTEEQWNAITIGTNNEQLTNATIICSNTI